MKHLINAMLHPFRSQNIKETLLIPGALLWSLIILLLGITLVAWLFIWETGFQPVHGILGMVLLLALLPIAIIVMGLMGITFLGYQWRMIAAFQHSGFVGPSPHWSREEWPKSFMAGAHFLGYCAIVFFFMALFQDFLSMVTGYQAQAALLETPTVGDFQTISYVDPEDIYPGMMQSMFWMVLIGMVVLTVLTPFILGPLFYNAQQPSLGSIFTSIGPAWRWTLSRYWQVSGIAMFCQMVLTGVIAFLMLITGITFVGVAVWPFILVGGVVLTNCLFAQAFSTPPTLTQLLNTDTSK